MNFTKEDFLNMVNGIEVVDGFGETTHRKLSAPTLEVHNGKLYIETGIPGDNGIEGGGCNISLEILDFIPTMFFPG